MDSERCDVGPIGVSVALRVAPLNGAGRRPEIGFRALRGDAVGFAGIADVGEDVAGVVQNNIENDVEAQIVRGIDQRAEFIVGIVGSRAKRGSTCRKSWMP